jgi:hypothetical protein
MNATRDAYKGYGKTAGEKMHERWQQPNTETSPIQNRSEGSK